MRSKEQLLAEIDATLEQLIRNAESLRGISIAEPTSYEVTALQKTQQSLLARLMHMEERWSNKTHKKTRPTVQTIERTSADEKIDTYLRMSREATNASIHSRRQLCSAEGEKRKKLTPKPRIGRNRKPLKTN